jgi:ParB family chromosome partitioning protein
VPISSIRPNPLQPRTRFDEEAMTSLASSIREVGVLQPVLVREAGADDYELIAGERRWRAARRAGLQTMPVLVQTVSDVHSLEQALVENLHREDLNASGGGGCLSTAGGRVRLHPRAGGRPGGKEPDHRDQYSPAPPASGRGAKALADGTISAGHARALLGTPDRTFQEELAKRAVAEGLTVRAVEESVRRHIQGAESDAPEVTNGATPAPPADSAPKSVAARAAEGPAESRSADGFRRPGVLELEDLLSNHLNTG